MGHYFGIYETDTIRQSLIEGGRAGQFVEKRNIFPLYPTLDTAIFKKIKRYYLDSAPYQLPVPQTKVLKKNLKNFKLVFLPFQTEKPMTSLVKIAKNKIFASDVGRSSLSIMDKNMNPLPSLLDQVFLTFLT